MSKIVAAEKKIMVGESIPYVWCVRFNVKMPLKRCKERYKEYKKTYCVNCDGGDKIKAPSGVDLSSIQKKLASKKSSLRPKPSEAVMEVRMKEAKEEAKEEVRETVVKKGHTCPKCPGKNRQVFYEIFYVEFEGSSGRGLCKTCYQRYRTVKRKQKEKERNHAEADGISITCGDCKETWLYHGGDNESCPHCTVEPAEGIRKVRVTITDPDGSVADERVVAGIDFRTITDPGVKETDHGAIPFREMIERKTIEFNKDLITEPKNLAEAVMRIFRRIEQKGLNININITLGGKDR